MTTQPTPAELEAADHCLELLTNCGMSIDKEPEEVRDMLSFAIAAHRAPIDPAQAHAAELVDTLSRQYDALAVEARVDAMRMSDGWASTHANGQASAFEKAHTMARALLAKLDAELKAVTP